jgi:hypothetical protein
MATNQAITEMGKLERIPEDSSCSPVPDIIVGAALAAIIAAVVFQEESK